LHTALAGFVEAGETFEQAVMRETFEETGIRIDPDSISYVSSQPWPFPRSCMIAFRATADDVGQEICIDPNEIVSAYWFDKSHVMQASTITGAVMNKDIASKALKENPSLELLIPPKGVVARTLIDDWLEDV
jgi:NAD+ diphosphatase